MSAVTQENRPVSQGDRSDRERSTAIDLANKLIEVGEQRYYVDMKESPTARFFRLVEFIPRSKRSRIVVPMSLATEFVSKLLEVLKFAETYVPTANGVVEPTQNGGRDKPFLFSVSLNTVTRRRYYFDVSGDNEVLKLRMSYVYADRRDNVYMCLGAVSSLVDILNEFIEKFPPLDIEESSVVRPTVQRRSFNDRGRRDFDNRRPRQRQPRTNNTGGTEVRMNLKVLEDPAPMQIAVNAKRFTFEVVKGVNTFLRVTEVINNNRKSTLHVPAEICTQIQDLIGDMVKKLVVPQIPAIVSAIPAQPKVTE